MYEREKSYTSIRPAKLTNKAGELVAESVEERGVAKGNLLQRNTDRAQGRRHVHQALERIRQAAKREKGKEVKFTSLWHHISSVDTLREAYYRLKRDAAAGVDDETWRHYGEALEDNLQHGASLKAKRESVVLPGLARVPPVPGRSTRPE